MATGPCILALNDYLSQEHSTMLMAKGLYPKVSNPSCRLPGHELSLVHAVVSVCILPLLITTALSIISRCSLRRNLDHQNLVPDGSTIPRCPRLFPVVMFMQQWQFLQCQRYCASLLQQPQSSTILGPATSMPLVASSRTDASMSFHPPTNASFA